MLTLYTGSGAVPLNVDDYYIRQLASGLDELCFEVSIWDEAFQAIQEESSIREQSDSTDAAYYLVKAIDAGTETANVKCQIDLDEWKASLIVDYKSASLSVAAMVRSVAPAGWTVTDESSLTYQRTIELTSATPLDVLEQCRETFNGVTYRFDNVNKVLTIVNMANGQNLGAFVTRDLNLKENNYKGKSTGFATRLYAYGKDGLSFASINGGKPYVDNNTYSSRVICAFWKDERYTVAANLLAAAIERLETMAVPQRSFDCDVVDLAATNPEKYAELDFALFSRCILIDQTRSGAQIVHIIVERWIYPYLPQKNKVVLSTVPPRIQAQVTQIINSLNNQNSIYQQQQSSAQQNAIENATEQITGAKGGYMRAIYDDDGNWTELVVMNTENILTASKLWRFNLGGFGYSPYGYNGPYTTAITMDGAIVADFITTGTLDASKANVTNLNASNIKTGTLDASVVTVSNLNASNITAGTLNVDRINAKSITGGKIADGTITGGVNGSGVATGNLAASTIRGGNVALNTITGGASGNISTSGTITTTNTENGINTNLGYAANYGNATAYQGAAGPTYFNVGQTLTVGGAIVMGGAGFTPKWSSTLNAYYLGSGGEG